MPWQNKHGHVAQQLVESKMDQKCGNICIMFVMLICRSKRKGFGEAEKNPEIKKTKANI